MKSATDTMPAIRRARSVTGNALIRCVRINSQASCNGVPNCTATGSRVMTSEQRNWPRLRW